MKGKAMNLNELLRIVEDSQDQFRPDFFQWLSINKHLWEEFERRSLQVAVRREHYSARTIAEIIRHDTAIGELNGDFKINGNYVPCLARLFSLVHPRYKNLFEFREQKAAA